MARQDRDGERERLFAHLCAALGNSREAAIRAGYPAKEADEAATRLLSRAKIQRWVQREQARLSGTETEELAICGLMRLAFGSAGDAVSLVLSDGESSADELAGLDLFLVSEIKRPKGGGCEVRLFDRLRALEILLGHGGRKNGAGMGGLCQALRESARAPASEEEPDAD